MSNKHEILITATERDKFIAIETRLSELHPKIHEQITHAHLGICGLHCRLEPFDNKVVYLPNGGVKKISIEPEIVKIFTDPFFFYIDKPIEKPIIFQYLEASHGQ